MKNLILSSRKSFLARIQTRIASEKIKKYFSGIIQFDYSNSLGDTDHSKKAWENHGFGIFTNTLSKKLINKEVDVVVHSFKDLPVKRSNKLSYMCLEREDPRDVVLIKKTSLKKKKLVIATSSPRREYYLKLLKDFLPYQNLKSEPIRGNIQTRLEKILISNNQDGVFIAKAAIDRIFKYGEKVSLKEYKKFKFIFQKFEKIILPLSEFPSAAAQGCIALEFRKDDLKIKRILNKINHISSLEDCLMERKYLAKWGGGCALDIGVTIENFLDKKVLFARGRDAHTKKYFKEKKYLNKINTKKVQNVFPSKLSKYQMFKRELNDFSKKLDNKNLLLTRGDYKETKSLKNASNITTSGISTWKKINQKGILVNSTLDGFGEDYREIEDYYKSKKAPLFKLSYKGNSFKSKYSIISHYSLVPSINEFTVDSLFISESFYWMSFSAFNLAIQLRPDILNKRNSCGPGQTYQQISRFISKENLNIYLSYEDFKKYELK